MTLIVKTTGPVSKCTSRGSSAAGSYYQQSHLHASHGKDKSVI